MKTLIKYRVKVLMTFLVVLFAACKDHELEGFNLEKTSPSTVSAGNTIGEIRKSNEVITVPLSVSLSTPATRAFQVGLQLNGDAIQSMIDSGDLANTVDLNPEAIQLPNVVQIPFGASTATFEIAISITALERFFGQNVALAINLIEPGKGNLTDPIKSTNIIVLNTEELIDFNDIHYISIKNGGGEILEVVQGENYNITSAGVTIPLGLTLSGVPGRSFNVVVEASADTIAKLIADGKLPANTVALTPAEYNISKTLNIGENVTEIPFPFSIPWSVMDKNLENPVAIAVSLEEPSRHLLHPTAKTVIILIDPSVNLDNNSPMTGTGVGLKAEYFKNHQLLDNDGRLPDLVRLDNNIAFDGWQPFPDAGDNWSSRWTGEFFAPVRGEYTFYQTRWDDGSRLIVNGVVLVDDFTTSWNQDHRRGTIFLERGQRYTIEAHHRENVGGQQAFLEYEVPSADIPKQIVPRSLLFPPSDFEY